MQPSGPYLSKTKSIDISIIKDDQMFEKNEMKTDINNIDMQNSN